MDEIFLGNVIIFRINISKRYALPELYTEFDAGQWAGLVESMTVYDKDRIVWKLTCVAKLVL